jgi:hypothetical protein
VLDALVCVQVICSVVIRWEQQHYEDLESFHVSKRLYLQNVWALRHQLVFWGCKGVLSLWLAGTRVIGGGWHVEMAAWYSHPAGRLLVGVYSCALLADIWTNKEA